MLTLTVPAPWPEAALDSDIWLFKNKHFCLRIIQIPCLFRFIWALFLAVVMFWAACAVGAQPLCLCKEPSSPSSSQEFEAHTVLRVQTQLPQHNPEKLRHSFCSSCCKLRLLSALRGTFDSSSMRVLCTWVTLPWQWQTHPDPQSQSENRHGHPALMDTIIQHTLISQQEHLHLNKQTQQLRCKQVQGCKCKEPQQSPSKLHSE